MDTVEVLTKAKELISDPSKWTTGVGARDKDGESTYVEGDKAVCWCALGAIGRVVLLAGEDTSQSEAYAALADALPSEDDLISDWNDTHTHAEVMDLFDRAIIKAKAGHSFN